MRNLEYLFTGVYIQFRPGEKLNPLEYYVRKEFVDKYGLNPETYRDEVLLPQLKELVIKYEPEIIFSDAGGWLYDDE